MLPVDGSYGEGGGQLLRMAVALSAIVRRPIEVRSIRSRRSNPGLAPQHLLAVRAVAALCGARVEGLALRSPTLRFLPEALTGGSHAFDVVTAGSVTLVLQALLPVLDQLVISALLKSLLDPASLDAGKLPARLVKGPPGASDHCALETVLRFK